MALFIIDIEDIGSAPRDLKIVDIEDIGSAPRDLKILDVAAVSASFNPFSPGTGMLAGLAPIAPARLPGGGAAQNLLIELYLQGVKVQETYTSSDGSWAFYNLQEGLSYDVVAKHPNLEGIISTKRIPGPMPFNIIATPIFSDATHTYVNLIYSGGFGPYTIEELSLSPFVQLTNFENLVRVKIERQATEEIYIITITPTVGDYEEFSITCPAL